MRSLLVSTYELGTQPLALASLAASLEAAGHEVRMWDLALEPLASDDLSWAEAACFSVPMHTALRLALETIERVRDERPGLFVALFGLYAGVGAQAGALRAGELAVAGAVAGPVLDWLSDRQLALDRPRHEVATAGSTGRGPGSTGRGPGSTDGPVVRVELGSARPGRGLLPLRAGLPPLDSYARFTAGGVERLVGSIEASTGCSHRCRHCPVPVVYDGRTRPVALDAVLADAGQLVAAGAEHIHFADPDFLNRPRHAREVVRALSEAFPALSYDVTIKVSHLLAYPDALEELATTGCAFVITAIESVSDDVLERLDKGHTAAGAKAAVIALRSVGIEPRPSLLPFTPWTTRRDLLELLDFVEGYDLVWNVDPVQWGIRLLLPPGSLLLEEPDECLARALRGYDPAMLGWSWVADDPLVDDVQTALAALTESAAQHGEPIDQTFASVRFLVEDMLGTPHGTPEREPRAVSSVEGPARPRLSETWFCCAEPTSAQRSRARAC